MRSDLVSDDAVDLVSFGDVCVYVDLLGIRVVEGMSLFGVYPISVECFAPFIRDTCNP